MAHCLIKAIPSVIVDAFMSALQSSVHGLAALSCLFFQVGYYEIIRLDGESFLPQFLHPLPLSSCNTLRSGAVMVNSRSPRDLVDHQFRTNLPRQTQVASNGSPKALCLSSVVSAPLIPIRIDPLCFKFGEALSSSLCERCSYILCGELQDLCQEREFQAVDRTLLLWDLENLKSESDIGKIPFRSIHGRDSGTRSIRRSTRRAQLRVRTTRSVRLMSLLLSHLLRWNNRVLSTLCRSTLITLVRCTSHVQACNPLVN